MASFHACDGLRRVPRRGVIQAGGMGALGFGLSDLFATQTSASTASEARGKLFGAADSVLMLWLGGGHSHQDMWDMKPDAPSEVRGEFKPIKTKNPDLQITEHLPKIAGLADKFTVMRGLTHGRGDHQGAQVWWLTGYRPTRGDFALRSPSQDMPSVGAIVTHEKGMGNGVPPYVAIPDCGAIGHFNAFLPANCAPFQVNADPSLPNFQVKDLARAAGFADQRWERRKHLLEGADQGFRGISRTVETLASRDQHYARAYELVASAKARGAFDLAQESNEVRDRYGRNVLGQGLLLGRRLVEHGCRFVTVDTWYYQDWDTHSSNFTTLKDNYLPKLDQGYSALLEDMERRGMLDRTLVLLMSEFGRTPKVNPAAGRDHWPYANVALFAGAGVKKGLVLGATDKEAAYPSGAGYSPEDVSATTLHLAGVDLHKELIDRQNRPWKINTGVPLPEVMA